MKPAVTYWAECACAREDRRHNRGEEGSLPGRRPSSALLARGCLRRQTPARRPRVLHPIAQHAARRHGIGDHGCKSAPSRPPPPRGLAHEPAMTLLVADAAKGKWSSGKQSLRISRLMAIVDSLGTKRPAAGDRVQAVPRLASPSGKENLPPPQASGTALFGGIRHGLSCASDRTCPHTLCGETGRVAAQLGGIRQGRRPPYRYGIPPHAGDPPSQMRRLRRPARPCRRSISEQASSALTCRRRPARGMPAQVGGRPGGDRLARAALRSGRAGCRRARRRAEDAARRSRPRTAREVDALVAAQPSTTETVARRPRLGRPAHERGVDHARHADIARPRRTSAVRRHVSPPAPARRRRGAELPRAGGRSPRRTVTACSRPLRLPSSGVASWRRSGDRRSWNWHAEHSRDRAVAAIAGSAMPLCAMRARATSRRSKVVFRSRMGCWCRRLQTPHPRERTPRLRFSPVL